MADAVFSKQPWGTIFLLYQVLVTLCFHVPLWIVLSVLPATRPHPSWSFKKAFLVRLLRHYTHFVARTGARLIPTPTHLAIKEGPNVKAVWVAPAPYLVVGEVKQWAEKSGVDYIRIPGYWQDKAGTNREVGEPPFPGEKVIFHLHGGGYAAFSAHPTDPTATIPRGVMEHVDSVKRAFSLEYRLSQGPPYCEVTNPFPTALVDAIAGYNYLVNHVKFKSEDIIVDGDSAGGNLALALVRYLVENQSRTDVTLPLPPGHLILSSPWTDVGVSDLKPGSSMDTNLSNDYIEKTSLDPSRSKLNFLGPFGMEDANSNRYISPGSTAPTMEPVPFKGFPRTFICAGGGEVLRDQIRALRDKMVTDLGEGEVEYFEAPGAIHDYLIFSWHDPEHSETLRRIANWLNQ